MLKISFLYKQYNLNHITCISILHALCIKVLHGLLDIFNTYSVCYVYLFLCNKYTLHYMHPRKGSLHTDHI